MLDHFSEAVVISDDNDSDSMDVDKSSVEQLPNAAALPEQNGESNTPTKERYNAKDSVRAKEVHSNNYEDNTKLNTSMLPASLRSNSAQSNAGVENTRNLSLGRRLELLKDLDLNRAGIRSSMTKWSAQNRKRPVEVVVLSDSEDDTLGGTDKLKGGVPGLYKLRNNGSRVSIGSGNKYLRPELLPRDLDADIRSAARETPEDALLKVKELQDVEAKSDQIQDYSTSMNVSQDADLSATKEEEFFDAQDVENDEKSLLADIPELSKVVIDSAPESPKSMPGSASGLPDIKPRLETDPNDDAYIVSETKIVDSESDDEIAEVTKEEAERIAKFKETTFDLQYPDTYYNKPIPVQHAGDKSAATSTSPVVVESTPIPDPMLKFQKQLSEVAWYFNTHNNERNHLIDMYEHLKNLIEARQRAELEPDPAMIENINVVSHGIFNCDRQLQTLRNEESRIKKLMEQQRNGGLNLASRAQQQSMHFNPYARATDDENHLRELFKEAFSETKSDDMAETPETLNIKLLDHQRQGLHWLLKKEDQKLGCLLADDMGLGKTVQTIALIMSNKPAESDVLPTLIVGPVSLLRQWEAEFETKVKPEHALRVVLFHHTQKKKLNTFKRLSRFDVVLVSYTTLANESKKHFGLAIEDADDKDSETESKLSYRSPFFTPDATFFRIVLDEAHYIKNKDSQTSKAAAKLQATHRLCLTGTPMQNKIGELYPILKFLRTKPYDDLNNFSREIGLPLLPKSDLLDVVERTAAMKRLRALLTAIMMRRTKTSTLNGKPLIVLPEKTVKNVFVEMSGDEKVFYTDLESSVQKTARDLLNGPQQKARNFVGILSLLMRLRQACVHKFLVEVGELRAWQKHSNLRKTIELYFKMVKGMPRVMRKQINRSLRPKPENKDLGSADGEKVIDDEELGKVQNIESEGPTKSSEDKEKSPFCESRSRQAPKKLVSLLEEILDVNSEDNAELIIDVEDEDNVSNFVESEAEDDEEADLEVGVATAISSRKKDVLSDLELYSEDSFMYQSEEDSDYDAGQDEVLLTCPLCLAVVGEDLITIFSACGHMICNSCVANFFENTEEAFLAVPQPLSSQCMTCRKAVQESQLVPYSIYEKIVFEHLTLPELIDSQESTKAETYEQAFSALLEKQKFEESAKIEKVLEIIKGILENSTNEKVIIFSNFTVTFDLMKIVLERENLPFLRYDGTMSVDQKNSTVETFYQGSERILLLSLRAGNVGLTLTCASHVILMEPFWNPYVEEQAMDRAHRLGQLQPVQVYRILTEKSVENRIMELQERKKQVIGAALDENALKLSSSLGRKELGYLFGLNNLD